MFFVAVMVLFHLPQSASVPLPTEIASWSPQAVSTCDAKPSAMQADLQEQQPRQQMSSEESKDLLIQQDAKIEDRPDINVEPVYVDDPITEWGREPVIIDPKFMYNKELSDVVPDDRALPEVRPPGCKSRIASMDLSTIPQTSVVIVTHNEAHSTLRRTVTSVINRSPAHLLKEIIVVDDMSDWDQAAPIEHFAKVLVVRSPEREGIMLARMRGFAKASAPTVTFLDAHVECQPGWLPPLLERIATNSTTVVSPVIDIIKADTLRYVAVPGGMRGIFDWKLIFRWKSAPDTNIPEHMPFESPAHAGGLFTISKAYFEKLGLYDSGMQIWGYENIELSLRVWMCGGRLEIDPCSRVGHIYRHLSKSPRLRTRDNYELRNKLRTVAVWFDDYAPQIIGKNHDAYGDVSERLALRKRLQCRSFQWYLDHIFPDHPIPSHPTTISQRELCLDTMGNTEFDSPIGLNFCHQAETNQRFEIDTSDPSFSKITAGSVSDVARRCVMPGRNFQGLVLGDCEHVWRAGWLTQGNGELLHKGTSKCLFFEEDKQLVMTSCTSKEDARWSWQCKDGPIKRGVKGLKEVSSSFCVDTLGHGAGEPAGVWACHNSGGNQEFSFHEVIVEGSVAANNSEQRGVLINKDQRLCLQVSVKSEQRGQEVLLQRCNVCNGLKGASDASCVWRRSGQRLRAHESTGCLTIAAKRNGGDLDIRDCSAAEALSWDTSAATYGLCQANPN